MSGTSGVNMNYLSYVWNQIMPGFNVAGIINNSLQQYNQPIAQLQNDQSSLGKRVSDWQTISADMVALQTASAALTTAGQAPTKATSSNSSVATGTTTPGAQTGSVSFVVDQIAQSNSLISSGGVASTAQVVTASPDLLLSQANVVGFSSLASNALTLGSHSIQVVQASQAGFTAGTTDLQSGGATITTGTNDTVIVNVNGAPTTVTIAAGTYTGAQLLTAVQNAIASAGASAVLTVGYNSSGQLLMSTAWQGSSQTLQVTGGNALATLGLAPMATASQGSDAVVNVDGTNTTLSTVTAGSTYTLNSGTGGSITAIVGALSSQQSVNSSLLSAGTVTANDISTGGGSLATVVQNINAANPGFTATAINTSSGYQLELTASSTGSASNITIAPNSFGGSGLGNLLTATAGMNSVVSIGGVGGPTVVSSTNSVQGLLPGLTANLLQASSTAVTLSVAPDVATVDTQVSTLVSAANQALSDISKYGGYDPIAKSGGPLMGNAQLAGLNQSILATVASNFGSSTLAGLSAAGITLNSSGNYTNLSFNQSAFNTAYQANPTAVLGLFDQGGSFNPSIPPYAGSVELGVIGAQTASGPYAVSVSQSATQATDNGAVLGGGAVTAAETLTFTVGASTVNYTTSANESLATIASQLNQSFAGAGLGLAASVVGGTQLQVASQSFGSAATFSVTTTNGAAGTTGLAGGFTGMDVAGTINGTAAVGSGQTLTAPIAAPFDGVSFTVTAAGIVSITSVGTYNYQPGLAAAFSTLANISAGVGTGWIGNTITGLQNQSASDATQITSYQNEANSAQQALAQQYATLAGTISSMQSTKTYLTDYFTSQGLL